MRMSYEQWVQMVARHIEEMTGLSLEDLPDCVLADWYEDEVGTRTAARRVLRYAEEGELA